LLTARDEMLAEQSDAAATLTDLSTRAAVASLEVGPLPPEHRQELVRGLLGLEGELAARVEERTAGNALFAVQLVGDWVQRGLLEPTNEGFRLRSGATVGLPEDVETFWTGRVARLAGRARKIGRAGIAAVLGRSRRGGWTAACAEANVIASQDLVDDLIARRLARAAVEGSLAGSFVHAMLRESLMRGAMTRQSRPGRPRRVARMLAVRTGSRIAERAGGTCSPPRTSRRRSGLLAGARSACSPATIASPSSCSAIASGR
jgi:hypothetical protein